MAPRTSARISARSGASRDIASSPPQSSRERDTTSPMGRTTRSTRSQSVEQQDQQSWAVKVKKSHRTASREGSVDSVGSNRGIASSRGGRTRQTTRTTSAARDLSIVAEGREPEDDEPENPQRPNSPGVSEISGTTAVTSRSQSQLAHMDSKVTDRLPELFDSSAALLNLLIPAEVSKKNVARITKSLMAPGSDLAHKLKSCEDEFKMTRDHFGTEEYIDNSFVLRKLFGSDQPGDNFRRPDPVSYLANLATLVKNFLVSHRESPRTSSMLETLDTCFPKAFASNFDQGIRIGGTALLNESFDIGLAIRTQYVISELGSRKDEDDFHPRTILASFFYDAIPADGKASEEFFDDADNNEFLKNILGDTVSNSEDQVARIHERVLQISETFNADIAAAAGDPIDFDQLNKLYPWSDFLKQLLEWAQERYGEIFDSITEHGGIDGIMKDVKEIMNDIDSQDTDYEQDSSVPNTQEVASSAPIISRSSNESRNSIKQPQNTKKTTGASSSAPTRVAVPPPSSFPQKSVTQAGPSRERAAQRLQGNARLASPILDDFRADFDDGDEELLATATSPAKSEHYKAYKASMNEKNKENLAVPKAGKKRSIFDPQSDAESVHWESQDPDPAPSRKRARYQPPTIEEEDEDEEDESVAFESDDREPNPERRKGPPASNRQRHVEASGPSVRMRTQNSSRHAGGSKASQQRQERARSAQPASSRGIARNNPEERRRRAESEEGTPKPRSTQSGRSNAAHRTVEVGSDDEPQSASQVAAAGRTAAEQQRAASNMRPSKRRQAWSERDTELLIERIRKYGCAWSIIMKMGDWDLERDGNALKDKACVLKANFLKAGVELPYNFECIRLKTSQVNDVRKVDPAYEPEP